MSPINRNMLNNKQIKKKQAGRQIERHFEIWIDYWNTLSNTLAVRLEVARTRNNKYTRKQPADYIIITMSNTWLIDSKETEKAKWTPTKRELHQIAAMEKMAKMGHKSGFVIWFKKADPAMINLRYIDVENCKNCTILSGEKFNYTRFFK